MVARVLRHPVVLFVAALALSALCFQCVPANTTVDALVQGLVLTILAIGGVVLGRPQALRRVSLHVVARRLGQLGWWTALVLAMGLAAGVAWWCLGGLPAFVVDHAAPRLAAVAALCLMTGIFEEGVFRVLALDALATRLSPVRAAVASAVLFALLHVPFADAQAIGGAVAWMQALLKPVQAGLFGFFMAALYLRTQNLWVLAGVHAVFDMAYLGPLMLTTGVQPAYVTGNEVDALVLAATVALLAVVAVRALMQLRADCAASDDAFNGLT